ncbi:MAG: hypothetical protein Q8L40_02615, partial [Burkholderiales bacterium]|nr:hypothetical protein [Burkholderiales bacterium]
VPEQAMTVAEVNKKYNVGDRDKHQKTQGKSQVVIDGLNNCFYPILESLDAPQSSARRVNWIEGQRLAFGLFEVPSGYDEPQMTAEHEMFIYVLGGKLNARVGADNKTVVAGDIIYIPRGDTYRLQTQSAFARYTLVCSTPYLEAKIDGMSAAEAEQAQLNMKPN